MRYLCLALLGALLPLLATPPTQAQPPGTAGAQAWAQCRAAIRAAEQSGEIPEHLLAAIGRVESGRRDPESGQYNPWPWTINAEGQGFFYDTKEQAIAAVRALQARGVQSIDVGCMQVNLMHHPDAFATLEQAFDPRANALYAARFLRQLHAQANEWPRAAGLYHSATPEIGADYERRVLAAWPEEKRTQEASARADPLANAWASTLSGGNWSSNPTFGRFAVALPPTRGDQIRIIPLGAGGGGPQGRGLDTYRARPIAIASRVWRSGS